MNFIFLMLHVLFIALVFFSALYIYKNSNSKLNLLIINKFVLLFIEFISFLVFIILCFKQINLILYKNDFNILLLLLISIVGGLLILYIGNLVFIFRNRIEMLFVILFIPLGISFVFFILPDYVPDEPAHFQRAYAVSNFIFDSSLDVSINSDYEIKKFADYSKIFSHIYLEQNPTFNMYHEACSYNFMAYIFPAAGLLIGRFLCLSLYTSYYLGRMMNVVLTIIFGYNTIKLAPKGKMLFFVLYFNPMYIHLSASYSADVVVLGLSFYMISKWLYLNQKEEIEYRDIIEIISSIFLIFVLKIAYLPIFGVYFSLIPKLLKMEKKKWLCLLGCLLLGILYILISKKLGENAATSAAQEKYYLEANVDSNKQIAFLIENPKNLLIMYINTFRVKIVYYFETFVSRLCWLEVFINKISLFGYYVILLITTCKENIIENKYQRIWLLFLGFIIAAVVVLGLYLYFTPVSWLTSEGVQGRYFIPCALLFLIAISNSLFNKERRINNLFIFCSVLIVNILVMKDLLLYFA